MGRKWDFWGYFEALNESCTDYNVYIMFNVMCLRYETISKVSKKKEHDKELKAI